MNKKTKATTAKVVGFIKEFVKSKKFKTFLWQTLNGFLTLLIIQLGDVQWAYAPVIISALNYVTKHINKNYLAGLNL